MRRHAGIGILVVASVSALPSCTKEGQNQAAQEQAEQAAERRAANAGEGPLDQQIAGEVAKERAELADEVGGGVPRSSG